jgi:membrane protease subunit (stomatin/prohibitin family)
MKGFYNMGLIKAVLNAAGGTLADQWVDFITCDSLSSDVLMVMGKKPQQARSTNTKGSENIISNGSKINVADGQCMLIVENGKVVDFCSEPGQYVYNTQLQPSLLGGGLKDLLPSIQQVGKRFLAGGAPTDQQKVYYINIKEILNNKIGWGKIPFRHYDPEFDKSIIVQVQGFGMYTFKIADPLLFYANLAGNVANAYTKETLMMTMKAEIMSAMNPALGAISKMEKIPYDELILYPQQLGSYINENVGPKWGSNRGIEIVSFAVESITVDDESAKKIAQLQETAIHTDAGMAGARLVTAQDNAMENAAKNPGGAMPGFIGMNMAQGAGGANAGDLFNIANAQKAAKQEKQESQPNNASADSWTCSCGTVNTGKFCEDCGGKKPEKAGAWTCSCGTANMGKFCSECGAVRPSKPVCGKCGWESDDAGKMPKFCPECGEKF